MLVKARSDRRMFIQKDHPTFYEFVVALKKQEQYAQARGQLVSFGGNPVVRKRKFVRNERKRNLIYLLEGYAPYEDQEDDHPRKSGSVLCLRTIIGHVPRGLVNIKKLHKPPSTYYTC